jgi:hypothetical protein
MKNNHIPLSILLLILVLLDLLMIGGILWKGHANFIEVYKHL